MEDIILDLERMASGDNEINREIAIYLLNYKGDYKNLKISDIVRDTFVSTAAVTRLAQTLGLTGFPELKIILSQNIEVKKKYNHADIEVFEKYVSDINIALTNTFEYLDYEKIIVASNILYNSKTISLLSIGNNTLQANDFQHKLIRIGKTVNFDKDFHIQHIYSSNLKKGDVAVAISYSGFTKEVIDNLNIAKKQGAKTILLTSNRKNKFDADIIFYLDDTESIFRNFSMTSRTSIQVILDLLYLELYNNNKTVFNNIVKNNRIRK